VLETPHVIIGAAIATKIPNPLISLPLAFGSHFLLDKMPHWNPHLNTEIKKTGKVSKRSTEIIAIDVMVALISGFFIATQGTSLNHQVVILAAAFLSVAPDVVEGPYFFLGYKNKAIDKWMKFQKSIQFDVSPVPGLLTQVVTVGAAFWWIFS